MKKYTEPEITVIEITPVDVIQTSGKLGEENNTTLKPGSGITFG